MNDTLLPTLMSAALLHSLAVAQTETAEAAHAADPALVRILAGGAPESVAELRAMEDHVQRLLEKVLPSTISLGGASGVIIEGGYVLTAGHVSRTAGRRLTMTTSDGGTLRGESLGANHRTDTGLIKITSKGDFPARAMGRSGELQRGDWCLMLGHPSGAKAGRSAPARLGRILRVPAQGFLVSDCTMQGGDSGGPLFDMDGNVIGINSRISGNLANNMHVAIDTFHREWDDLVARKVVQTERRRGRGSARVTFGARWDREADNARVREVIADSPADKAGLKAGDVVVKFAGRDIASRWDYAKAMREREGDDVVVVVERDGASVELSVKLERRDR